MYYRALPSTFRVTRSHLFSIAQAVTDEADVDWTSAEATTDPQDLEAVRQLRLIASIGQAARRLATRWGPFVIRQAIGSGTFGTVYRAWDPKLEREIALKLLNDAIGRISDAGAIHEARLLATVEHPNIVPVYGADVHDGRVGIWMKFVHGRTLKEILDDQGPFAADEAALIGRDLCRALAVVHAQGLVHRDLKAQNVMREVGGQTILMDFGAGHAVGAATESLKGTPAYLAPEIVAGQAATPLSDLYSLGVLLYHLVTGQFPVVAPSWDELRTKHAQNQRRLLGDVRPNLPKWFVAAVDQSLSADPGMRPASAGAMVGLLDAPDRSRGGRVAAWALAASVLVAAGYGIRTWSRPSIVDPSARPSVAIVPFENLTGSTDLDFLSSGLARQVGTRLAAIGGLRVVVPSNAIRIDMKRDPAGQLGVGSILSCWLRGNPQRVRLGCDLRDARSNREMWADTTDRRVEDIVSLESELARRVAFALVGPLNDAARTRLAAQSVSPDVLSLYLRGRHEWSLRTEDSLTRSIEYYESALRGDPKFALAYSGIADAYTLLGAYGFMPRLAANAKAYEAAARAVALDANLADAQFSLGYAQKNRFEWTAAEASFRRGLELNADSSTGHHWYSMYLTQMGRFPEAIAEVRQAIALDTSSLAPRTHFASLLVMARRYRDGIAEWESCITLGSGQVNTYRQLSKAYLYFGNREKALEFADAARRRAQAGAADEELKADLAYVFASTDRRQEAIDLANELVLRYRSAGEGIAGSIAAIYTGLGDFESAFTWLAAAERDQDPELGYLRVDPKWDPLRADERFRRALASVGLSDK
jgi:eukaryotic-like serine/threonine-protein kinase